jgi:coenzyme F420-reducing hydrogenase gamma subunit
VVGAILSAVALALPLAETAQLLLDLGEQDGTAVGAVKDAFEAAEWRAILQEACGFIVAVGACAGATGVVELRAAMLEAC